MYNRVEWVGKDYLYSKISDEIKKERQQNILAQKQRHSYKDYNYKEI